MKKFLCAILGTILLFAILVVVLPYVKPFFNFNMSSIDQELVQSESDISKEGSTESSSIITDVTQQQNSVNTSNEEAITEEKFSRYCIATSPTYASAEANSSSKVIDISKNSVFEVVALTSNYYLKLTDGTYVPFDSIDFIDCQEFLRKNIEASYDYAFGQVVNASTLNLRELPSTDYSILSAINEGGIVRVYNLMKNGWYYVEANTIYGYVSKDYIALLSAEEYAATSSALPNFLDEASNLIATNTTKSSYGNASRTNMHAAADYLNGSIINPDETFSFLAVTHPEGCSEVYVESVGYDGHGNSIPMVGGGICQVSSTTYGALIKATEQGVSTGISVTARRKHSGSVSYTEPKYEATVNSGTQDLCFRNLNDYPIEILASYDGNTLTVSFYAMR